MSRYAQSYGNGGWQGGSEIIPKSKAAAMDWAETHLTVEEVERHFGDDIEDA